MPLLCTLCPPGVNSDPRTSQNHVRQRLERGRRDDRIVGGPRDHRGDPYRRFRGQIGAPKAAASSIASAFAIGEGGWEPRSSVPSASNRAPQRCPPERARSQANTRNGPRAKGGPGMTEIIWQRTRSAGSWAAMCANPHLRPNAPPGSRAAGQFGYDRSDGSNPVAMVQLVVADRTAISRRIVGSPDPCAVSCGASQR